ncbi:MAG: hypothetical protein ACP5QA_16770, partial [Phycisphaerae bacterium]
LEKKRRIVEEMLMGESQEKVARKFNISTGEASNIWTDFREGNLIDREAGVLSEEIKDIARMAKESKVSPGEFSDGYLLGRMLLGLGVEPDLLSGVAYLLKGLDERERKEVLKNLKEISGAKREGESLPDAERRFLEIIEKANEAQEELAKARGEIKSLEDERKRSKDRIDKEIAELRSRRNELKDEIEMGLSISKITDVKDRENVVGIVRAAKGAANGDDFVHLVKIARAMRANGVSPEGLIRSSQILNEAEKNGFSIKLIGGVNEECRRREISFDEFLREMISMVQDRKTYEQDINSKRKEAGDLSNKLTKMKEELAYSEEKMNEVSSSLNEAENILSERKDQLKQIEDLIAKGNEKLSRLGREIAEREASLTARMREGDFAERGIKGLKELEDELKRKRGEVDRLDGEMARLRDEISSKTN